MKIYEIVPGSLDVYKSLYRVNDSDKKIIDHFLGIGIYDKAPASWLPIPVSLEQDNKQGDFLALSLGITVNNKALSILRPLIEKSVNFLPLKCDSGKFFMLKINDVIDCLDYSRAKVKRFTSSGRVMHVSSYAFNTEKLEETIIFKIPEQRTRVYVKQEFKDLVENNNLEGLIFTEIYSE